MTDKTLLTPEIAENFLSDLRAVSGMTENSNQIYRYGIQAFMSFDIPIDVDVLQKFDMALAKGKYTTKKNEKKSYSRATSALYIVILRKLLEWMDAHDMLEPWVKSRAESRFKTFHSRSAGRAARVRKPAVDLARMISYFDGMPIPDDESKRLILLRDRALLHFLWDSAARISEVLSLTRNDVRDGMADQVMVTGKGEKDRLIFLSKESRDSVRAYLAARKDTYPGLFISQGRSRGASITRAMAWQIVKKAALGAGIEGAVSPHMIRHARATQLVNEGMPMESVQMVLGHADISTTQIYYAHMKPSIVKGQFEEYGLSSTEAAKQSR